MKTTVEIAPELLRAAKRAALDRGTSLEALIETGLRRELATPGRRRGVRWVAASGVWPAGLDVSNRDALWAWLEHGDPPR
ncbi:MAG: hypothetical protein ACRD1L_13775 [Terriglobales bacterium]